VSRWRISQVVPTESAPTLREVGAARYKGMIIMGNGRQLRVWGSRWLVLLGVISAIGSTGCGGNPIDVGEESGTVSEAMTDPSGAIHTTIFNCGSRTFSGGEHHMDCTVPAPTGWFDPVLIGGAGRVNEEEVPGVLLTRTSPYNVSGPPQDWTISAKDHVAANGAYQLDEYGIGLRIDDVDSRNLRDFIHIETAYSQIGHSGSVTVNAPPGEVVLGGGATCTSSSGPNQQLLVASKPFPDTDGSTPTGWTAICKDHQISSPGFAEATVISMRPQLNGRVYHSRTTARQSVGVTSGYAPLVMSTANAAISGVGGYAAYRGGGRLLTAIWLYINRLGQPELLVDSKDHINPSTGWTIGYMIILERE
jgi:hypothetical protein